MADEADVPEDDVAVTDSRPASLTVPTDLDLACLTTSTKGCDRLAKSS